MEDSSEYLQWARRELDVYCTLQWPQMRFPPHIESIIKALEEIVLGLLERLIANTPPQHGKTSLFALFMAWFLGNHPDRHVVYATHTAEWAESIGRRVRGYLSTMEHLGVFPECRIRDDSSAAHRFDLTAGGSFYAIGVGGALTGRPAHLVVVDDPIRDAAEARSETVRRGILDWYQQVVLTRQQPGAAVVLIQTRWHLDDLTGSLLREQTNNEWRLLSFPAFDGEGRALWPERYNRDWLLRQQRQMGVDAFSALYMQNPVSVETQIFKPHLWRYYDVSPHRIPGTCVIAVDPSAGVGRDNAAFVVMRGNADGLFVLDMQANNRWQLHEQKQILEQLAERYQPSMILVETEATTGADLVSEFRRGTLLPIKGVKTEGRDKLFRSQLLEYLLIDGKVHLPREADWLQTWLEESAQFPVGKSDDRVDAYCYAAAWLRDRYSNGWSSGMGSVIQAYGKPIACGSELRAINGEPLPDPCAGSWESPRNWRL